MRLIGTINKIGLYILSLSMLFIFVIILSANVPLCFNDQCSFIGFKKLLTTNTIPIISIFFILLGAFFLYTIQKYYKIQRNRFCKNNRVSKREL